ncbi:MAG: hypothetical protein IPM89_02460 [Candidatus Competibacteraceae bacterium]|nr:MAG: hypothetical protein IPM89_02460 [Candidatus Competibacteraceae bacterium]
MFMTPASLFAFGPSVEWLAIVLTGNRYDIRIKFKGQWNYPDSAQEP